jgi:hypothetical protein
MTRFLVNWGGRLCLALLWASAIFSCQKGDEAEGMARVRVFLTDSPADYEEVNIDVREVLVNLADDEQGWIKLDDARPGVYNLLELTGGIDTLLAEADLPSGKITQIRLLLGNDNTVKVDGVKRKLATPSAQQSGLKINLRMRLEAGLTYKILLDFDAARSVVRAGASGMYLLKPVIRAAAESDEAGAIAGEVVPRGLSVLVSAFNEVDTLNTYVNEQGRFLLRSVPPGRYTLTLTPSSDSGLDKKTIPNVDVSAGRATAMGEIRLAE